MIELANNDWEDFAIKTLYYIPKDHHKDIAHIIREYFFTNKTIEKTRDFKSLTRLLSSRLFFLSEHHSSMYHAKVAPLYLYHFNHSTEFGFLKLMRSLRGNYVAFVELGYEIVKHHVLKFLGFPVHGTGGF